MKTLRREDQLVISEGVLCAKLMQATRKRTPLSQAQNVDEGQMLTRKRENDDTPQKGQRRKRKPTVSVIVFNVCVHVYV